VNTEPSHSSSDVTSSSETGESATERNAQLGDDLSDGAVDGDTAVDLDPLAQALNDAAQFKDKWMRTAADFDNYRKRTRREVSDAEKKGRDQLLRDLLPVFDNLERATVHANLGDVAEAPGVKGLLDGIDLVARQFRDALSRLGIERIESVGRPFDPSIHEAIQHLETAEFEPGCIAAEVQPGYRDGERLLRPALVVVAKAPPGASTQVN
jgi:molecular chaperone GrpE